MIKDMYTLVVDGKEIQVTKEQLTEIQNDMRQAITRSTPPTKAIDEEKLKDSIVSQLAEKMKVELDGLKDSLTPKVTQPTLPKVQPDTKTDVADQHYVDLANQMAQLQEELKKKETQSSKVIRDQKRDIYAMRRQNMVDKYSKDLGDYAQLILSDNINLNLSLDEYNVALEDKINTIKNIRHKELESVKAPAEPTLPVIDASHETVGAANSPNTPVRGQALDIPDISDSNFSSKADRLIAKAMQSVTPEDLVAQLSRK